MVALLNPSGGVSVPSTRKLRELSMLTGLIKAAGRTLGIEDNSIDMDTKVRVAKMGDGFEDVQEEVDEFAL
jgi:hypothetical protein